MNESFHSFVISSQNRVNDLIERIPKEEKLKETNLLKFQKKICFDLVIKNFCKIYEKFEILMRKKVDFIPDQLDKDLIVSSMDNISLMKSQIIKKSFFFTRERSLDFCKSKHYFVTNLKKSN